MTPRHYRTLRVFLRNLAVLAFSVLALTASRWMPSGIAAQIGVNEVILRWLAVAGVVAVLLVACNIIVAIYKGLMRSTSRYYLFHDALWPVHNRKIIAFPLCAKCRVRMGPVRQVYLENESYWECSACSNTVPAQTAEGQSIVHAAREQAAADRKRRIRRRFRKARRRRFVAQEVSPQHWAFVSQRTPPEVTVSRRIKLTEAVVVYGSDWCPHTQRMLKKLRTLPVFFRYVNVDENREAEQRIAGWNNGRAIRPTLEIGGDVFVAPDAAEVETELMTRGLLAKEQQK